MKKILLLFAFAFALSPVLGQKASIDSLKRSILKLETDSVTDFTDSNTDVYVQNNPDSGIYYARALIAYGKKHNDRRIIASGLNIFSYALYNKGNYPAALNIALQSLRITENSKYSRIIAGTYNLIGNIYKGEQNYPKALYYYMRCKQLAQASHFRFILNFACLNMAFVYKETNVLDSALYYSKLSVYYSTRFLHGYYMGYILGTLGDEYFKLQNYKKALGYYQTAYALDKKNVDFRDASMVGLSLARFYNKTGRPDSAIYYARGALTSAKKASYNKSVFESAELLSRLYEAKHQPDSGFKYLKLSNVAKDSLYNAAKSGEVENLTTNEFLRQNEILAAQTAYQNRLKLYALIFGLLILLIAALLQWRNSRQRKKAYILLQKQKEEIESQKAQAQIETSLERVRAQAMSMACPDDLLGICEILFTELEKLGFNEIRNSQIFIYNDNKGSFMNYGFSEYEGAAIAEIFYNSHPKVNAFVTTVRKTNDAFAELSISGDELKAWRDYRIENGEPDDLRLANINTLYYYFYSIGAGAIGISNFESISAAQLEVLKRFRNVFDLAYRRYADIELAGAQARESQIELALERVRARTMAMQHSDELAETVSVLFKQLLGLGITSEQIRTCGIVTFDAKEPIGETWITETNGDINPVAFKSRYDEAPAYKKIYVDWKKSEKFEVLHLKGEKLKEHLGYVVKYAPVHIRDIDAPELPAEIWQHVLFFSQGYLFIITRAPLPGYHDVFKRFGIVFQQSYTRFLDLKKAEAQAREGQIELALERVRARTMAMQKSDELPEAANLLFQQVQELGMPAWSAGYVIWDEDKKACTLYMSSEGVLQPPFKAPLTEEPSFIHFLEAWQRGETFHVEEIGGEALVEHYKYMRALPVVGEILDKIADAGFPVPTFQIFHSVYFSRGFLLFITYGPVPAAWDIFKRFGKVFELTYTRFLDLKNAEAQARESKIEAALERVRGKAMAMYNSADLTSTASMVFTELRKLGIEPMRCGISIQNKENRKNLLYSATASEDGHNLSLVGWAPLEGHPVLTAIHDNWMRGADYFPVLKGDLLKTYYEKIKSSFVVPAAQAGYEQFGYFLAFSEGTFYGWAEKPFTSQEIKILKRFTSVIDLTFRRYIELQKSEASANEAVRAASLDRVRAEIASMRSTDDLEKITPLIWNELTILGIPFIRCGVFIVDEQEQVIHTHLSTPDGKALAAFDLQFDSEGIGQNILPAWRKKQIAAIHWTPEEFAANTKTLVSQGAVKSKGKYVKERPDTSLDLHLFPFLQGMLYVGNTVSLSDDEKGLVQSLADAFSTAYARYEDFNKLEAAKQQVDKTLSDLKAAQTQLIQSEKMASLGELTAGIAHEIQNPLNFVNNFSEVNAELIEEMKDEIEKGGLEEIKALALDIEENSKKITLHGKRADAIVKGMLQHSQSGSGAKEPANINSIADEYMRLAYHGLRAKDKSFNAEMVTHFDPDLPKITVIGQDIGRVMLNLFNNAFYAVNKKQKTAGPDYKPEITVTTYAENMQVIIKVKDNGVGIPGAIKDKIMQPFFTTKPTGEGTGLGLSLTYDMVVKGHGGSIQVESAEGEGSEFIIQLPVS